MAGPGSNLPDKRYFRIGEVCKIAELKPHVLRYWETEFKQVRPQKNKANQRLYRKKDVETILLIKNLLHDQKYTIAGAKAKLDADASNKVTPKNAPKQMAMEFDHAQRDQIIKSMIEELKSIKAILDKDPDSK